jgi:hypothetical protein
MTRRWTVAMALAMGLGGLAGCGGDEKSATTPSTTVAPAPAEPTELTLQATEYSFAGHAEVKGGLVRLNLKNLGKLTHEATLLAIGDTPPDVALAQFDAAEGLAPIPESISYGGGAGATPAGTTGTTTFQVKEGNYLVVCTLTDSDSRDDAPPVSDEPSHYSLGMGTALTVTAGPSSALPATEGTIVAREDTARRYTFDVPRLTAGHHELSFRNDGPQQFHHAQMLEFPPGVDEAGAREAFSALVRAVASGDPPPPGTPSPRNVPGTGATFAPRLGGTFSVDLKAGQTYLIACFIQDRQGGPPHVVGQGMMTFVTVR